MNSFIIYRSVIEAPLNLNCIILKEMFDFRNHKNWALPFGPLLTKVLTHFRVKFRKQHNQFIDGGFSKYMISHGISVNTSEEKEDEESSHQTMEIKNCSNNEELPSHTENIPQDPSAQPREGHPS